MSSIEEHDHSMTDYSDDSASATSAIDISSDSASDTSIIDVSSDSESATSSIPLGDDQADVAPVRLRDLDIESPEYVARVMAAGAEHARYYAARAALEAKIARLSEFARQDYLESRVKYANFGGLHQANYITRLTSIADECTEQAGLAVVRHVSIRRIYRILEGLPVPEIEDEVMGDPYEYVGYVL
ncbi:hypothetical protein RSOLAG22IIIB_10087 [Rhizoctonia solani]|uniref:Uncharacterized protein n=1 Tax=Rhizoctonia solani TaxID=456999 RepID=A0A0K6G1G7_9AGAM|nr:hypothetical protein RSOLAG22IIIB_10087 [Rhizoctonia solani]